MSLLAIDLGLRCGFACFAADGMLLWFRSQNMGTVTRLKRAIPLVLDECEGLTQVTVEGDRRLGELWQKAAVKRGAAFGFVAPETWRAALLLPRERRSGVDAKEAADHKARAIIEASIAAGSALKRPRTALVDDVAEAICIGAWALHDL